MSNDTKSTLEKVALGIAIASFLYTVAKAVVLIPHDVDEMRARMIAVEASKQADHDLLQRIDERTAQMQKDMDELKRRK